MNQLAVVLDQGHDWEVKLLSVFVLRFVAVERTAQERCGET